MGGRDEIICHGVEATTLYAMRLPSVTRVTFLRWLECGCLGCLEETYRRVLVALHADGGVVAYLERSQRMSCWHADCVKD